MALRSWVIGAEADAALARWATMAMVDQPRAFPRLSSEISTEQLTAFAEFHGITSLLWSKAAARPEVLPNEECTEVFSRVARFHAVRELVLCRELGHVLSAAHARGLTPLVLKGTALAYSLYAEPSVRQRHDTDLLVALEEKPAMVDLLESMGYVGEVIAGQHWATSEHAFEKQITPAISSRLDLHWRLSNSPIFWRPELDYSRLTRDAQRLPALHQQAYCPPLPVLLLHACIHRAGHFKAPMKVDGHAYAVANRLIWLYDVHLLASAFDNDAWGAFVDLANRVQVLGICSSALEASVTRFNTEVPHEVVSALAQASGERSFAHVASSRWRIKLLEFRALPTHRARTGWLREHLMPRREYMQSRFGAGRRWPLVALHVKRMLAVGRTAR